MQIKIAKLISLLLGPHIWLPIIFITLITKTELSNQQLLILAPTIIILQIIFPLTYLILAPRLGLASAWDLKTRKERRPMLVITLVSTIISTFFIYLFGTPLLFHLSIIFIVMSFTFFIVNNFWQISLHMGLNIAGILLLNFFFKWNLTILYIFIPIIYWSRLTLKKHTPIQLLGGIIVSIFELFGGLWLFGYI